MSQTCDQYQCSFPEYSRNLKKTKQFNIKSTLSFFSLVIVTGICLMSKVNGNGRAAGETEFILNGIPDSAKMNISHKPILRIGIVKAADKVDFQMHGSFTIVDVEGNKIFSSLEDNNRWRADVEKFLSPRFMYYVHLMNYENYDSAKIQVDFLQKEGYPARIVKMGKKLELLDGIYIDSRKYRLMASPLQGSISE